MLITDFHIHSKYSRACSTKLDLPHIEHWCGIKGIDVVATSDFTHPKWFAELKQSLTPVGNGLFQLADRSIVKTLQTEEAIKSPAKVPVSFILFTEVSCIYSQGGKVRRLHLLIAFPELEQVAKFNAELEKRGAKLASDGRPILGMSGKLVAQIAFDITPQAMVIPAHAWTPWFAIFGSKSGFDTVEECFEELAPQIFALETGLSSDPLMNWQISKNDRYTLISNSDAHSLDKLGREANVFDLPELSYQQIYDTIKIADPKKFLYTIEFFPEAGKYHVDGHADCHFACEPERTKKLRGLCPTCGKNLTVGVYNRVNVLADHQEGREKANKIPFKKIVPLPDLLADLLQVKNSRSKKVEAIHKNLIEQIGNEFFILLDAPIDQIASAANPLVAKAIQNMRAGTIRVEPGYDGIYGKVQMLTDEERAASSPTQAGLF